MSIYAKLIAARIKLQNTPLKKSGHNTFANYSYFELGDFLPVIQQIFADMKMCGVISYDKENATLTIVDTENPESMIVITSPMAEANLKGAHPIQNLGAMETYQRRYLWMTAMEIVENDVIDAVHEEKKTPPPPPPPPKPAVPKAVQGDPGRFQITVMAQESMPNEDWLALVQDACKVCLELAKSQADVMTIFQKNKQLLDKVKAMDGNFFKGLMATFSEYKHKF